LIRTRFLQALFAQSSFIVISRHPIAVLPFFGAIAWFWFFFVLPRAIFWSSFRLGVRSLSETITRCRTCF
jgi:hypothetical protein